MILINQLGSYFAAKKTDITEIKEVLVVMSQEHLADTIRNATAWPALIVVVPGAKTNAYNDDNIRDASEVVLLLVSKLDIGKLAPTALTGHFNTMQVLMERLKVQMLTDKTTHTTGHLMHDLEPDGMVTEPEYNYMGTYGWSLSFTINPTLKAL